MAKRLIAAVIMFLTLYGCEENPAPAFHSMTTEQPGTQPDIDLVPKPCLDVTVLDPGSSLPRRLTNDEYESTVKDLFGFDLPDGVVFPPEEEALGFNNNARALQATPLHAERYMYAAELIAQAATEDIDTQVPCMGGEAGDECIERYLHAIGVRAWRRPLDTLEQTALLKLYRGAIASGESHRDGVSLVITALLQSPSFLYRIEVGTPSPVHEGLVSLTNYEMAARLSYFIWRSRPDDALFLGAETGELLTDSGLAEQIDRMLEDPRANAGFWHFFEQWLHLDGVDKLVRDPRYYPDFDASAAVEMKADAKAFIEDAVWANGGTIERLFKRVFKEAGDPADVSRVGILSHPAILAATSKPNMTSPIHRGIFVREQLLCTALPPPPPDLMVVAPDPDPNLTTRQLFEAHSADPSCAGCHQLIDPLGLGFEHFDAIGQWRDIQNGRAVDASGEVLATTDINGPFYGLDQLAGRLATSDQVHRCVTTQVFRYAMGRGERSEDGCTLESVYGTYVDSGYDFKALVKALAMHPNFRHRGGPADD
ncbi:MAG: DUF1588 domain-containing protein [Myxococcota bacterium]|nr:DUF1588 domain-containing protein [Myxococcota bacterium]